MTFTKILCPIDFSSGSRRALDAAIQISRDMKAQLVIAHAFHIPPSALAGELVLPSNVLQELLDSATKELNTAVSLANADGANATGVFLQDLPWQGIVDLLERQGFDLCVLGTHGRSGLSRVLLGSVAEKVVRHARCNVLVVRPSNEVLRPTHALVPTDFSIAAEHALDLAAEMVAPSGQITLLHVIEIPTVHTGEIAFPDYSAELERGATEALQVSACRIRERSNIVVNTRSLVGLPGPATLSALDSDPTIDMVVMGCHGRTGLARFLLGSVAEKVVRHARTRVLIARPEKHA